MIAYLQEMANSLQNNKLRTFLTGFSIAWGIIILVVMLGAGKGVENGIRSMVSSVGGQQVEMSASLGKTSIPYGGYQEDRQLYLTPKQFQYLREINQGYVRSIEPSLPLWFTTVSTTEGSNMTQVNSLTWTEQNYNKLEVLSGRLFSKKEHEDGSMVAVITDYDLNTLFGYGENPVGKRIKVWGIEYTIVGVARALVPFYGQFFIPYNTYCTLFPNEVLEITTFKIYPSTTDNRTLKNTEERIKGQIQSMLHVSPDEEWAIHIENQAADTAQAMDKVFMMLQALLWIMGVGSLAVGTVGVSNIMHVTVQERMREIGIRKAIGAKPRDIMWLVLGESLVLSIFAGLVGLLIGVGLVKLLDYLTELNGWGTQTMPTGMDQMMEMTFFTNPEVNLGIGIGALVVLVVAGLIAGYGPAKKAIKIPAVVAMRDQK